jgi:hypothetical protein
MCGGAGWWIYCLENSSFDDALLVEAVGVDVEELL